MFKPFEAFISLRYLLTKIGGRYISFIMITSIFGVALGVMTVITAQSVINGFERDLLIRTVGTMSHATVISFSGSLTNWQALAKEIERHPEIVGTAPYHQMEGMLSYRKNLSGAIILAILPEEEKRVSNISEKIVKGNFHALQKGKFAIIIGKELAISLNVDIGDKVVLLIPKEGISSRFIKVHRNIFTIAGIFEVGMYDFDNALALINLEDAKMIYGIEGPIGLRIKTKDILSAPYVSREVMSQIPGPYGIIDWMQINRNAFRAIDFPKRVMFVMLILIITVAAFNIVATLIMTVTGKQADIAILRTLGASPRSIMVIFIIHGTIIGVVGIALGNALAILLTNNIDDIVRIIEITLDLELRPCDVYLVCGISSKINWAEVIIINIITLSICSIAAIYPAWRAAQILPAETLRYE